MRRNRQALLRRSARVPLRFGRPTILAIHAFAQLHARFEVRGGPRGKRHRGPGPGVAADPRAAETEREVAEAPDLDAPTAGETRRHLVEHHLHCELDVALDDLGLLLRNPMHQLGLRHRPIVARALWGRDPRRRRGRAAGASQCRDARSPPHRQTNPPAILIDAVNDDRIRPDSGRLREGAKYYSKRPDAWNGAQD